MHVGDSGRAKGSKEDGSHVVGWERVLTTETQDLCARLVLEALGLIYVF